MPRQMFSLPHPGEKDTRIRHPRLLRFTQFLILLYFVFCLLLSIANLPSNFRYANTNATPSTTLPQDLATLGISLELGVIYRWATMLAISSLFIIAAVTSGIKVLQAVRTNPVKLLRTE